ncbi:MAG: GGDEF domain-containing protein, partial [Lachnospiraceae bacterium]|nr:GGDEF domain-containing protein [Lachnospiraceae bacterium]
VEAHWKNVHDAEDGNVVYVFLVSRELESSDGGADPITGLMGKSKLKKYVEDQLAASSLHDKTYYAIVYLNFVNFKFLNITLGVEEGDKCLKCMADIMGELYDGAFISRLSDDHFAVFARYENIHVKTREVKTRFDKIYGDNYGVSAKCGIYRFRFDEKFDFESALSFAKVACDYIKYDAKADIVDYSGEIAKSMIISEYVVRNIDTAISEEWLKIYYQPVVRTLTRAVCGAESLVRWIDPEIGFLAPNMFIETLEKNRLIHKLDCFVVSRVFKDIRERMDKGLPVIPISVNFSRLDFIMCDMLEFVESERKRYNVPANLIHVEITESMFASDEDLMKSIVEEFREAGYEVWMDDFGSGYSSLMLLKDYSFDVVKFDMRFLTPFTENAKLILSNLVAMSKDIGIRTLTEGVENEEEVQFLHSIGCGRIQGYYYGKPEPIDDFFKHAEEKGLPIETAEDTKFYDEACLHIRPTDAPLEIIEDNGNTIRTLYMNNPYKRQIFNDYPNLEEADRRIYGTPSPLLKKYRQFADIMERTGKQEEFFYTVGGNFMHFVGQVISRCKGRYIIKGRIVNL